MQQESLSLWWSVEDRQATTKTTYGDPATPDRGTGAGSDGSSASYSSSAPNHSGMDWTYSTHRGHQHHSNGGTYRTCKAADGSPPSAASSTTLTGSPNDPDFAMSDPDALKSPGRYCFDRARLTPPSEADDDGFFDLHRAALSRKRPFESDSDEGESAYHLNHHFSDNLAPNNLDLPSLSHQKVLCASS